jgi:hypothetical protein
MLDRHMANGDLTNTYILPFFPSSSFSSVVGGPSLLHSSNVSSAKATGREGIPYPGEECHYTQLVTNNYRQQQLQCSNGLLPIQQSGNNAPLVSTNVKYCE